MALSDFFRINMPYGIKRNDQGEWATFNREYQPLGYNKRPAESDIRQPTLRNSLPIFTKYKGLSESRLRKIIDTTNEHFTTDDAGKINMVWFYNDGTNPADHAAHWPAYVEKLKLLAKLSPKENDWMFDAG